MPLVCDKLSIRLKEQGLRKYDLRKDKIIGMSALGKLRKNEGHIDTRTIEALCEYSPLPAGRHHRVFSRRGNG